MKSELRVHGVSGTPARNMLYTDPVSDTPTGLVSVWRRPVLAGGDEEFDTRAFHWGGLTSGKWYTAFWVLLGPFMLANAAGWMARRTGFWGAAFLRLAGLGITGLFVVQAMTAGVAIPAIWFESCDPGWWCHRRIVLALAIAVPLGFWFGVWYFTGKTNKGTSTGSRLKQSVTASAPVNAADGDPARDLTSRSVTSDHFMTEQRVVHALRRGNIGFGLAIAAAALARIAGDSEGLMVAGLVCAGAIAGVVALLGLGGGWLRLSALPFWVGAAPLVWSWVVFARADSTQWAPDGVHQLVAIVGVYLGACGALVLVRCGWLALGAIAIAGQFGGVLGIAISIAAEGLLGIPAERGVVANGAGWVSVAMVLLIATMILYALLRALGKPPAATPVAGGRRGAGRRLVVRTAEYLRVAAAVGLISGAGVVAVVTGQLPSVDLDPNETWIHWVMIALAGAVLLAAIGLMARLRLVRVSRAVGVAVALVVLGVVWWDAGRPGLPLGDIGITEVATGLAILLPGGFILDSVVRGVRQGQESRRKVGILWDVGSFWPRWFHPLAPPDYGAFAVGCLRDELRSTQPVVVGGHSQGSLVAAMALHHGGAEYPDGAHPGFISYGSQLGWLYPQVFPTVGFDRLVASVSERLGWINLWRSSDPIGGHIMDLASVTNRPAEPPEGHSGYEPTPAYRGARAELAAPA